MPKVYLPLFIEWTEKYVFKAPMFWSTFSSVFYSEWNIAEICNGFSTLFYILDSCHYVLQLALCVRACVCGCACAWECVYLFVSVFCVRMRGWACMRVGVCFSVCACVLCNVVSHPCVSSQWSTFQLSGYSTYNRADWPVLWRNTSWW